MSGWDDFWSNWRSGCDIIGDNLCDAFSNVGKRYQQAGDHFANGNIMGGLGAGFNATMGAIGNTITIGGANALGNSLAGTVEYKDGDVQIKEEYRDNFGVRVAHFLTGADTEASTELIQQRLEASGDVDKAQWVGTVDCVFKAADFIPVGKLAAPATRGVKKLASNTVGKVTNKVASKALARGLKEGTEEVVERGAQRLVKETVEEGTKKLVKKGTEKVVKEAVEEGAEKVIKETVEEGTKKLVKEGTEKAVKETVEKGAEKVIKETVKEGTGKAVKEVTEKTIEQAVERGVKKGVTEATKKPLKQRIASTIGKTAVYSSIHRGSGAGAYRYRGNIEKYGIVGGTIKEATDQFETVAADVGSGVKGAGKMLSGSLFPRLTCFCNTCHALFRATEQKFGTVTPVAYVIGARKKILGFGKYKNESFADMANKQKESAVEDKGKTFKEIYKREVISFDEETGVDSSARRFMMGD